MIIIFRNLNDALEHIRAAEAERLEREAIIVEQANWMEMQERDIIQGGGWD